MYDWAKLAEPFAPFDIEWRIQQSGLKGGKPWGKVLAYVTNRAIMERLDAVVGPGAWRNEFTAGPGGGVMCGIGIKIGDEWITKYDGAENTDIEPVKGGISGAMKRAAVHWGIGRYLYNLEGGWARFCEDGIYSAKIDGNWFSWSPPDLPAWALPGGGGAPFSQTPATQPTDAERKMQAAKLDKLDPVTQTRIDTMIETYAKKGVRRADLAEFIGHDLTVAETTGEDMSTLREVWSKIMSGEKPSTWFPHWFEDDDLERDGSKLVDRVMGAGAKLGAAIDKVSP